jgi:hypothetical protein
VDRTGFAGNCDMTSITGTRCTYILENALLPPLRGRGWRKIIFERGDGGGGEDRVLDLQYI